VHRAAQSSCSCIEKTADRVAVSDRAADPVGKMAISWERFLLTPFGSVRQYSFAGRLAAILKFSCVSQQIGVS
jgi:hypothetical protein